MTFLLFHRAPSAITPLASWLGPEVGARTALVVARDVAPQYQDWAGVVIPVDNYEQTELAEYAALRWAKEHAVRRVVALSEYDLLRAARIRDRLGVPGQSVESATAFRDKYVMKGRVAAAGIAVPRYRLLGSAADVFDFVEQYGLPVVVKPVAGAGSVDTEVLRTDQDVERWLSTTPLLHGSRLIETYVEGDMYHVDGLVVDGLCSCVTVSRYTVGCLAFQSGKSLVSVQLDPASPMHRRLETFAYRVLDALPTPEAAAFHLEVFHTPDDELVFCEIAGRIGGGRVLDAQTLRHGFNVVEYLFKREMAPEAAAAMLALRNGVPKSRLFGFALVPPRSGTIVDFRDIPPGGNLKDITVHCRRGQRLDAARLSVSAMASVVAEGHSEAEVEDVLNRSVSEFEQSCVWQQSGVEAP